MNSGTLAVIQFTAGIPALIVIILFYFTLVSEFPGASSTLWILFYLLMILSITSIVIKEATQGETIRNNIKKILDERGRFQI